MVKSLPSVIGAPALKPPISAYFEFKVSSFKYADNVGSHALNLIFLILSGLESSVLSNPQLNIRRAA